MFEDGISIKGTGLCVQKKGEYCRLFWKDKEVDKWNKWNKWTQSE
jgi:hypothetical protein